MPSVIQRTFNDLGNSIKDAYSHVIHGDDPGTFETFVFIAKPQPQPQPAAESPTSSYIRENEDVVMNYVEKYDLGMTFAEVNGRAYVNHVIPGSDADRAGIMPQDCLQLATIPPALKKQRFERRGRSGEMGFEHCDDTSMQYAVDCEKKGMRTSFEELVKMFEGCTINKSNKPLFTSKNTVVAATTTSTPSSFQRTSDPKSSLRQTLRWTTQEVVGRCTSLSFNSVCTGDIPIQPPTDRHPIFMVFRHTQSKKKIVQKTHHMNVGLPSFHLEDECQRAAGIVRRLAPMSSNDNRWETHDLNDDSVTYNDQSSMKRPEDKKNTPFEALDTVEASAIRRMIQNAVGLAFVKASKVVLGLSFHFGSGIVIGRLEDGSWSAPSAIGMYGAGLGLQFGLEFADYIFIIQTNDALDHFRRGTNYTVGGNFGAAVGGIGREAIGAASVSTKISHPQTAKVGTINERQNNNDGSKSIAPIVAYAKSKGLYFGVSLEGSKIFVREDINHRTYQFSTGRECSTDEILSGVVPPPSEAEDLYATLHNLVFAQEIALLPRPPDMLQKDIHKNWTDNSDYLFTSNREEDSLECNSVALNIDSDLSISELKKLKQFEAETKRFMYEGVSVQRIIEGASGKGQYCLERRTLWLMLPEVGSLRLGFLCKESDGCDTVSSMSNNDDGSAGSATDRSTHVEGNLSKKLSMNLTDVVSIERCPQVNNVIHSATVDAKRLIKVESCDGKILLFITNNIPESEVVFCGLKLLVDKETSRLGVRGGKRAHNEDDIPLEQAPEKEMITVNVQTDEIEDYEEESEMNVHNPTNSNVHNLEPDEAPIPKPLPIHRPPTNNYEHISSTMTSSNLQPSLTKSFEEHSSSMNASNSHGSVSFYDNNGEFTDSSPREKCQMRYVQGQVIHTQIATNVSVSLPLPLCRALLLDSTSPLLKQWVADRGDYNFTHDDWILKHNLSPRGVDYPNPQEFELIAKGNMTGASRTCAFERIRKGQRVCLAETWGVDIDDSDKFVFNIVERMPRRGFSLKVRVAVRPSSLKSSDVTIVGEVVPLGKITSDQATIHRAFILVMKEVRSRYGLGDGGLLDGLLKINVPNRDGPRKQSRKAMENSHFNENNCDFSSKSNSEIPNILGTIDQQFNELNSGDDWVQFGQNHPDNTFESLESTFRQTKTEKVQQDDVILPIDKDQSLYSSFAEMNVPDHELKVASAAHSTVERLNMLTPQRKQKMKKDAAPERPATPSMKQRMSNEIIYDNRMTSKPSSTSSINDEFVQPEQPNPIKIDVKPLPKIRLDLMPSPREADEEFEDDW